MNARRKKKARVFRSHKQRKTTVNPTHDDASSDRTHHTTSPFMRFRLKSSFVNWSKLFHNVNIKLMSTMFRK
ncbi:hypothetical protein HanRHA438_Chr11g0480781 [Helianthus annuus]|nr:hypothetical protein HanRHA438_Chr11g0480781 [Helianthus annuus]